MMMVEGGGDAVLQTGEINSLIVLHIKWPHILLYAGMQHANVIAISRMIRGL